MPGIAEFIENYTALVIDGEAVGFFQIIHMGSQEVWATIPNVKDADTVREVEDSLASIGPTLPTGKHTLIVQAISSTSKAVRGQYSHDVHGTSAAAKSSGQEQVSHAKALAMNIETASNQLNSMTVRLEAADERARSAEERAGNQLMDGYKMADMVHNMLLEKERASLDDSERLARMASMKMIGESLAPILGQAIMIGSKFVEIKMGSWEKKWEANADASAADKAKEEAARMRVEIEKEIREEIAKEKDKDKDATSS